MPSPDPRALSRLSTAEWIRELDAIRANDELLRRGYWHGYTESPEHTYSAAPMRGYYYLVRWEQPTVAISHDDRDDLIDLAKQIERALSHEF